MSQNPANWGDWRPCKLCKVVQPPRSLDSDGCCKDTSWCVKHRHAPEVPSNGAHKDGTTQNGQASVEVLSKSDPKKEITSPGTPKAKAKARCRKKK